MPVFAQALQGPSDMPTVADLTGAADPITFFQANIVQVLYTGNRNAGQVWPMWMADGWMAGPAHDMNHTGRTSAGAALPVVTIMNIGGAVGATFNAFWCPYEGGTLRQATLDATADFMFTAKMDGCTFAVGSDTATHARTVCHVNLGGQGQQQLALASGGTSPLHNDAGMRYLGPGAYRVCSASGVESQATTFGVRRNQIWEIWSQVVMRDRNARTLELVDVLRIA